MNPALDVEKWDILTKEHFQKNMMVFCALDAHGKTLIGLMQRHGRLMNLK